MWVTDSECVLSFRACALDPPPPLSTPLCTWKSGPPEAAWPRLPALWLLVCFGQREVLAGDQRAGVEKGQGIYPPGSFLPGCSLRRLKS